MKKMKLFIGSDHKGYELEHALYLELKKKGYQIEESTLPHSETDDYPDFAFDVASNVLQEKDSLGIILCGNGIGVSIASNKIKGIYCARVTSIEDAHHARAHNGCNMIALGGIPLQEAVEIAITFIKTDAPNEERHLRRINKVKEIENGDYHGL